MWSEPYLANLLLIPLEPANKTLKPGTRPRVKHPVHGVVQRVPEEFLQLIRLHAKKNRLSCLGYLQSCLGLYGVVRYRAVRLLEVQS